MLAAELREDPESVVIYIAYCDDVPVSTAWVRFHAGSQFASLWGGSTLPDYRGRGLYTDLLPRGYRRRGVGVHVI